MFSGISYKAISCKFINSTNYLGENAHPKQLIVENLKNQLSIIQKEIDSIERHHPYFKNGFVLSNESNKPDEGGTGDIGGDKYYMHSNKKRLIKSDTIYRNIKKYTLTQRYLYLHHRFVNVAYHF